MRFLWLALLLMTFQAWAQVPVEKRALLAIVDLAQEATRVPWLYRLEGAAAVRRIHRLAGPHYGRVVVHTKKAASEINFLTSLKALLRDPQTERIDVVIYVHGKNPTSPTGASICFVGTPCSPMRELAAKIRKLSPENLGKLRMLYSDACWGQFHMDSWLLAGFRVVSGAEGVDANHSADLRRFLKAWGAGQSFSQALDKANAFWLTPLVDRLIGEADSFKLSAGETELTIED